jgi:hypothetical protein
MTADRKSAALAVGFLFALVVIISDNRLLNDPDTYWHIAAGNWIIDHWAVPVSDPFSATFIGQHWTAHEWLSELVLAAVYNCAGWTGILVLFAAVIGVTGYLFGLVVGRWVRPLHTLITSCVSLAILMPHLLARPHVLILPLTIIFVSGLVLARDRQKSPPFWYLLAIPFWTNMHGSFLVASFLVGFFALESLLARDEPRLFSRWALFLLGTLLLSIPSPNGIDNLFFLPSMASRSYLMAVIPEWRPMSFGKVQPFELWLLVVLGASLYAGIRIPASRIVLLLCLIHFTLQHVRGEDYIALIAPLAALPSAAPQFYARVGGLEGSLSLPRFGPYLLGATAAMLMAAITLSSHQPPNPISPRKAIAAVNQAGISGTVFNGYGFGGYLIFNGIHPFIDSRAELYSDDFMKRFVDAYTGNKDTLQKLFEQYDVAWTLLEPTSPANASLSALPGWRKFYSDDTAVVFVRQTGRLTRSLP